MIFRINPPYTVHTIKLNGRKHAKCVKMSDGNFYFEIYQLVPVISLPRTHFNRITLKIFKYLALVVLPITLSQETIDMFFAFSHTDNDFEKQLVSYEVNYTYKK